MNISDRKLYYYENDRMKNRDEQLFLDAMVYYNDIKIGVSYLMENKVFRFLFGDVCYTDDPLRSAARYTAEIDDDVKPQLLQSALSDGYETLLERIVKKIKNALHVTIDVYFNIRQRQGFAF